MREARREPERAKMVKGMAVAFKTSAVANEFLDLAEADQVPVTPMMLQKLLYFAHGWHLAITGQPLIDDQVEAWKFGPVVPSIYHEFKSLGKNPIGKARSLDVVERGDRFEFVAVRLGSDRQSEDTTLAKTIIRRVWETHKHLSGIEMSAITHQPGSPWAETWDSMGPTKRLSKDIPEQWITEYFRGLSKK